MNYDLQVTVGGYLSATLESIVSGVSGAIGLYPGYTYQRTEVVGDVIHIFYSDDYADPSIAQAELLPAVPAIVWAILAVLSILGIAYIAYELRTVVQTAPTMVYAGLAVAGVLSLAYLIRAVKKGDY